MAGRGCVQHRTVGMVHGCTSCNEQFVADVKHELEIRAWEDSHISQDELDLQLLGFSDA